MTTLYEDSLIKIFLPSRAIAKGHLVVSPQRNISALEECSDDEVQHLFYGASYAATALFEFLGAHGTNIVYTQDNNTLELNVVARFQDDGLDFLWKGKSQDPQQLEETAKNIRDRTDEAIWAAQHSSQSQDNSTTSARSSDTKSDPSQKDTSQDDAANDYRLRSLRRIP